MTQIPGTTVTFPQGATRGTSVVVLAVDAPDGALVVTAETPFHPVDHQWPDQPGDRGVLRIAGNSADVVEASMAALSDDGTFAIGAAIPARRGEEGWSWLVAHRLSAIEVPSWLTAGASIDLEVDEAYRASLSRGHSACHLAALALNAVLDDFWSKPARVDSFGHRNFDAIANQSSQIVPHGSVDTYRLGKSLRKAGFDVVRLSESVDAVAEQVTALLQTWLSAGGQSEIVAEGAAITDRRTWRCTITEGTAEILCGGTHVSDLAELGRAAVLLEFTDPQTLKMTSAVVAAAA